jgi:predicted ATPase
VLLLLTHRPDFEPPWPGREHLLPIRLNRLRGHEAKELIAGAIAEAVLSDELVERIATRSDGVPLFVEELAKGVVEAGHTDSQDIPETLQDSLMARLDRLGEAKAVAQLGAAIGREFEYTLLEAVAPLKEPELREQLGRLVAAELVYQRGLPPRATYTFKHALVQDTAYQSLLDSQRQELHGRIADALEQRFPERVAREPELIARHCEEAGLLPQAIFYYQRAGERATERSAYTEATHQLSRGIGLLRRLPETGERNEQELRLQILLAAPTRAAKGGDSPEVASTYERARQLCREIGDRPALFHALAALTMPALVVDANLDLVFSCLSD